MLVFNMFFIAAFNYNYCKYFSADSLLYINVMYHLFICYFKVFFYYIVSEHAEYHHHGEQSYSPSGTGNLVKLTVMSKLFDLLV